MLVSPAVSSVGVSAAGYIRRFNNSAATSATKLASGVRVATGSGDPGSIATAAKLKGNAGAWDAAAQAAQNAAANAKAADSAYGNALDILYRMKELATQRGQGAGAGITSTAIATELSALNATLKQLGKVEITTGATSLGGAASSRVAITISFSIGSAGTTLSNITTAINTVAGSMATTGAQANALGYVADGFSQTASALWSGYNDFAATDIASEMSKYVTNSVNGQSAQLILAQYNQNAYSVLNLLK